MGQLTFIDAQTVYIMGVRQLRKMKRCRKKIFMFQFDLLLGPLFWETRISMAMKLIKTFNENILFDISYTSIIRICNRF